MTVALLFEVIGWAGSLTLLGAYLLMSVGRLPAVSIPYGAANLVGSLCLGLNGLYHGALPPATLNAIWVLISLQLMWRCHVEQTRGGAPK